MNTKVILAVSLGFALGGVWMYLPHTLSSVPPEPSAKDEGVPKPPELPAGRGETWVQGRGFTEPASEVRRLVFKVDGVVAGVFAQPGDRVGKGTVLMALDNREQEAAVALAESELGLAQAERGQLLAGAHPDEIAAAEAGTERLREQVRHQRGEYDRSQRMRDRFAVGDQEYQQVRTDLSQQELGLKRSEAELRRLKNLVRPEDRELAEARVQRAEAQLQLARQRLADMLLVAPCDGTVLEVLKREGDGQRLIDNQPSVIFGDLAHLRIRAEIDERYARQVREGQRAVAFGRGLGGESYQGRVAAVRPIMGKKSVFSGSATERRDLDVVQVIIELTEGFTAPVGLQVDVRIQRGSP
jgi:multidrug resistance efflux pump